MRVLFGDWTPDRADLDNPGMEEVRNAVASEGNHYEAFQSTSALTTSATVTLMSAISVRSKAGITKVFAAGKSHIYGQSLSSWASVSRTASYSAHVSDQLDVRWSFAQFGDNVYACNGNNPMQVFTLDVSTTFQNMSASASAPEARYLTNVRDHIFAGCINGFENRVQWPRINNPTRWTPSVRFQADYQDIPNGGKVQQITGGDFAAILMEESLYRASYVGSPLIYRFDEVAPGIGCDAPYSAARFQNVTFFHSRSGFYAFDGQQAIPIGDGKVDDWFDDMAEPSYYDNVAATIDPLRKLYILSFASKSSTTGAPDMTLVYNWARQRWTFLDVGWRVLFSAKTVGYTLEGLDAISASIDALGVSLDSSVWKGGSRYFAAITNGNQLAEFTGSALTARFITGDAQLAQDARTFVSGVRPLIEGTTAVVSTQIGKRDLLSQAPTFSSASAINTDGWCPHRVNARYHRVRVNVSGSFTSAIGFDFMPRREGIR